MATLINQSIKTLGSNLPNLQPSTLDERLVEFLLIYIDVDGIAWSSCWHAESTTHAIEQLIDAEGEVTVTLAIPREYCNSVWHSLHISGIV
jgi:hypothetical protein